MSETKAIAFYLPQFHPIPENDLWWGKGFTEWSNVVKTSPSFADHYQPRLPGELGFYDLRLPEVRAQQAALARRHGIYGFCYYYYWFNGRRLLERPLDDVLHSGEPDFPFCICWANENWTRRWDGAEDEILIRQHHSEESDQRFISDILPILRDPRYIRIDGAPLLLVYRADLLPNPVQTAQRWRSEAAKAGIPALHVCAMQSFGIEDPRPLGFDSACEFPPHTANSPEITADLATHPDFAGRVYDYREAAQRALAVPSTEYLRFRCVMTGWDNTPRRGMRAHIFHRSSPEEYELWLRGVIARTEAANKPSQRFVFINAWNEWAEGAYLEPDQKHGHAYLEATSNALRGRTSWRQIIRVLQENPDTPLKIVRQYVSDLSFALEAYDRSLHYYKNLSRIVDRIDQESRLAVFTSHVPTVLRDGAQLGGRMHLERVQGIRIQGPCKLRRTVRTPVEGWGFAPSIAIDDDTQAYLVLRSRDEQSKSYFAPVLHRVGREDVSHHFSDVDRCCTAQAGFSALLWCEEVPSGTYDLGIIHAASSAAVAAFWDEPVILD